jgi:NDP-sugar pyrophosphorylase family protein
MVLAAGLGTRLKPFTDRFPKPLIPLHGIPCMEYALLSLSQAGVTDVMVNVHAHPEKLRQYLSSSPIPGLRLRESDETDLLLGSAGGFKKALPFFEGQPFFSMNADVFHLAPLEALKARHFQLKRDHGVVMTLVLANGAVLDEQEGQYREIQVDESRGLITGWGEKKAKVPFFTGSAIYEPEAFDRVPAGQPAEFVPEVLEPAIRAGKVGFLYSEALWLDIGSPELWFRAEQNIRHWISQGKVPEPYLERLKNSDPTIGGRFELGKRSIRLEDIHYEIKGFRAS